MDHSNRQRHTFQFGLHSLLIVVAIVAILLGWWLDHRRLARRLDLLDLQVQLLQRQSSEGMAFGPSVTQQSRFATAGEFVSFLRSENDHYKFDAEVGPFVATSGANDAVEPLLALLNDPKPETRWRSLCALGRLKRQPDIVVPALIRSLNDPHANVGWYAANALGAFGTDAREAIPALRERMLDDDSQIATFSATMLNRLDPTEKIGPRLIQLTGSKHRENRWRAVPILSDHVDAQTAKSVLTAMFEKADKSDTDIREMIAVALNKLKQ